MIRVEVTIERESLNHPNRDDVFVVLAEVDLPTLAVRWLGGTVKRHGSKVPPHTLTAAQIQAEFDLAEHMPLAIAEARLSSQACAHCAAREVSGVTFYCGDCLPAYGEIPSAFAESTATVLVNGLMDLLDSDPALKERLVPLRAAAKTLATDASARALRETSEESFEAAQ